ncbi:DNA ligase LigA-related protein [Mesobacillus jeotgali]|uniref:DNA ligase LigA-related protein n=1 Tax=Mesobacillus jeotgali TaxID=129985 RepID=UPI0038507878
MDIHKFILRHETPLNTLHRYQRNFLVHSFLYYKLNETIISDDQYDERCKIMNNIIENCSELAKSSSYYELCKTCGKTGSGYYIKEYPIEIITRAFHLLYQVKKPNEDFPRFVLRWGYRVVT